MVVELRKSKLNLSIVKQTGIANEHDLKTCRVLGWCLYASGKERHKFIMMYNDSTKEIRKYLMFDEIEFKRENNGSYCLTIKTSRYNNRTHYFNNDVEVTSFLEKVKEVQFTAKRLGQIFL